MEQIKSLEKKDDAGEVQDRNLGQIKAGNLGLMVPAIEGVNTFSEVISVLIFHSLDVFSPGNHHIYYFCKQPIHSMIFTMYNY
jgi:hypothetical protein